MIQWIRESNLIENIDDAAEDERSEQAWKWFCTQPLTQRSVLELHRKVTWMQLVDEYCGKLRKVDVRVGSQICPSWQVVPKLYAHWFEHSAGVQTEDAIRYAHIAFERVHPFVDGNGRTGRMIMNWQRKRAGFEPLLILASRRWEDYYPWFREGVSRGDGQR